MMSMAPTDIGFEEMYEDQSGVEFGVVYRKRNQGDEIELIHIGKVGFPIDRLDWLIDRLNDIRNAIDV